MAATTSYILPQVRRFDSLDELLKAEDQPSAYLFEERAAPKTPQDLFSLLCSGKKALILGEAGFGKSRLLTELSAYLKAEGRDELRVNLARLRHGISLEDLIALTRKERDASADETKPVGVLLLDGLDEIEARAQVDFRIQLRTLIERSPETYVVASARLFDYRRSQLLHELGFTHFLVTKFSASRIRKYLEGCVTSTGSTAFSQSEVATILEEFLESNWESIISIPRYLELFVQFHLAHAKARPRRIDLYNYFVNQRLSIEDGRLTANAAPLLRRLLEKIALVAEIYQRNSLTFDEVITILEETDSPLANQFLGEGALGKLVEHSICKATSKDLSFEDRTLQEYLASCELMRLGGQRHLYELVVDSQTKEIHPSWHATLSFCVDHDPSLLPKLLDFANQQPTRAASSQDYHSLLLKAVPGDLDADSRRRVFQLVFGSYQNQLVWIDWSIARRLIHFFDVSLEPMLRAWIKPKPSKGQQTPWFVTQGNVVAVVANLLGKHRLPDESVAYWKPILVAYAVDDNQNGVLQGHSLEALGAIKDEDVLESAKAAYAHPEQLVREAYVRLCAEVAPNSKQALETFVAATKSNSIYGPRSLAFVTGQGALKSLIDRLNSDDVFLLRFSEHEQLYQEERAAFFRNVDAAWTSDFSAGIISFLLRVLNSHRTHTALVGHLIDLLQKHLGDAVPEIMRQVVAQNSISLWELTPILTRLLNSANLEATVTVARTLRNGDWMLYRILAHIRDTRGSEGLSLYEQGRALLPDTYKDAEAPRHPGEEAEDRDVQVYRDFQFKLEPEKGKYIQDVFEHFATHKVLLQSKATPAEMVRLKELSTFILEKTDTRKARFEVLKWGEAQTKSVGHFSISSAIIVFEHCVPLIQLLNLPVSSAMRMNLINAIPYAEHQLLESIFALVTDIQPAELADVIACYATKDDRYFRPSNLVETAKRHRLLSATPVLKTFVADASLERFYRQQALDCLAGLDFPKAYFESIYALEKTKATDLAFRANAILIERFQDPVAVRLRFAEIKRRAFPFKEELGVHTVSDNEHELSHRDFAKPLTSFTDDQYIGDFLELLKWSIDLGRKGPDFLAYSNYVVQVVLTYFKQLLARGSYRPIRALEQYCLDLPDFEGKNWLLNQVKELFREYQFSLGAPKRVIDCIRSYNRIKRVEFGEEMSEGVIRATLHDILTKRLENWIINEGARELFYDSGKKPLNETRLQKILDLHIRREVERLSMTVVREPQKLNDERVDFLIAWGFSPNIRILIEVKKSDHGDLGPTKNLKTTMSYRKLQGYMKGYGAESGFFLVLNISRKPEPWTRLMANVELHYKEIPGITVVGINCH